MFTFPNILLVLAIILLALVVFILIIFPAIGTIASSMRSSQISREEEARGEEWWER